MTALPTRPRVQPSHKTIHEAVRAMGKGPLTEGGLIEHVWPLFSRSCGLPQIYLANHSLGRPLDRTAADVGEALDMWYADMDGVWSDDAPRGGWLGIVDRFRALTADLIGCPDPKAVVPRLSAGAGVRSVLNAISDHGRTPNVLATRNEFDSTDFILKTYHTKGRARVRFAEPSGNDQGVPLYRAEDVISMIDGVTDLVIVSQVFFNTGQAMPGLAEIARAAHEHGALMLVDTYHSAGVFPMDLMRSTGDAPEDADFAVGGSYKYVRGGTGACWLAVHPKHLENAGTDLGLSTLDTGWFAKKDTFSYERTDEPLLNEGGDAWLESTPSVLPAAQALAGLEFTLEVGLDRLRAYNLEQQRTLRDAMRAHKLPVFEPSDEQSHGAFVMLAHDDAPGLSSKLKQRGVNTDARSGFVRFGPDVLNTTNELIAAARITYEVATGSG
jgi:kynureninase